MSHDVEILAAQGRQQLDKTHLSGPRTGHVECDHGYRDHDKARC